MASKEYRLRTAMAGRQTPSRNILSPKKPSKILKKRKTVVEYNRRDCELTAHQQSWARSLAVSLSGWRARQAFLKAQHEAFVEAEAARAAEEATLQATLQAREDRRRAQLEILQATSGSRSARDAVAYRKGTSHIHEANIGNMTEEELADEEYMHDYVTWNDQDDEDDDGVETDTESAEILSPVTASPAQTHSTPVAPPARSVDWRVRARNGITKKKLTISKGWSAFTWNQKANVHERLLLLENDGYDIANIKDRKASSEEITAIILERVAAQQQSDDDSSQTNEEGELDSDGEASSPRPPTDASPLLVHQDEPAPMPRPPVLPILEDDTQPFCFNEPYHPHASSRLKRKRDSNSDDEDLEVTAVTGSYHTRKKHNTVLHTVESLRLQALQEIKRKVLRRVFRPARSICQEPSPFSKVIFSAEALLSDHQEEQATCTLDYLYPKQTTSILPDEPLSIPLAGYSNIMAELRFLTDTSNVTETSMPIVDPDFEEEELDTPAMFQSEAEDNSPHSPVTIETFYYKKSRITISEDDQNRHVFQGDALTLAELFKVLRQQELFHRVDWEWDGMRLIPSSGLLWSLGPQTQDTLLEVERRLRQYAGVGGAEIYIQREGGERAGSF
ncbi:hypothetical protein N0V95_007405 [Ascochyta clinopodiicola]|nr:hypothetical protein N0V95_007405 [Ascochyta clinopodiicola]